MKIECKKMPLFSNGYNNKIYIADNICALNKIGDNVVDFIYIDPPYNTNHQFAYQDSNKNWSSFMEKRLDLAKKVMKDSAVICISIDDNELANLLSICYKIFGKINYVGIFITKQSQRSNAKFINIIHEYVVVFAKNKKVTDDFYIKRMDLPEDRAMILDIVFQTRKAFSHSLQESEKVLGFLIKKYVMERNITWIKNYSNIDDNGNIYFAKDLSVPGEPNSLYIEEIGLKLLPLKTRKWSTKEKFIKLYKEKRLCFKNGRPYEMEYLTETVDNISSILNFYSRQGTNDLKKLGLQGCFDTPKPVELIKFLIRATMHKNSVILDFFAGSGTTGQAVYEVNSEDNVAHKYILVQNKEQIDSKSNIYKNLKNFGYLNPSISDVLLARIKTYLSKNNKNEDFSVEEL